MKPYLAQIAMNLKLTARDRMVLFFNYAFPLVFFFFFGQMMHADQGGTIVYVVSMVLTMGVLGNGFFGAGIRAAQEREQNILRRFKVAPISPAPLLVSSLVTGLLNYLPTVILVLVLSHVVYGMAIPERVVDLIIFLAVGIVAFRAIGLIIASVVNSMQESQILVQILYLPMLLLSIMPMSELPSWAQTASQFVPAVYLQTGMQGILYRNEGLAQNASSIGALLLTIVLALFVSMKLFRWEKEDKVKPAAKLWIAGVLVPFFILGGFQMRSHEAISKGKLLVRELERSQNLLIRGVRIFAGDGRVIDNGAVYVRNGKVQQVFTGESPDPKSLRAEVVEGAGKTVLPGLIDVHVHVAQAGGLSTSPEQADPAAAMARELAAYLYCGVTAVKSVGDPIDAILKAREQGSSGEHLGAELFISGPQFTTEGGHGTEYFSKLPDRMRMAAEQQMVRTPKSADEARRQVRDLKARGVDAIKAVLDAGHAGMLLNRMDPGILAAIVQEAHAQLLPVVVHTVDSRDVEDALKAGADGIEHGSVRDTIPDSLFQQMKARGVTYDPTLTSADAFQSIVDGSLEPLERPLVEQVVPAPLIQSTRDYLKSAQANELRTALKNYGVDLELATHNLVRAWQTGVTLVTGTGAGNPLVFHGPSIHRELQLWVQAGVPPVTALTAATHNAANLLRQGNRMGLIQAGYEANLVIVDGDPTKEIRQTESIQQVILKGERIRRAALFEQ